jgi:hypothetical protein
MQIAALLSNLGAYLDHTIHFEGRMIVLWSDEVFIADNDEDWRRGECFRVVGVAAALQRVKELISPLGGGIVQRKFNVVLSGKLCAARDKEARAYVTDVNAIKIDHPEFQGNVSNER